MRCRRPQFNWWNESDEGYPLVGVQMLLSIMNEETNIASLDMVL